MVTSQMCIKKYGIPYDEISTTVNENTEFERNHMVLWDVPNHINLELPIVPNRIYCNKDLVAPLEKAFKNIIDRGLQSELKTWDGCFNIRNKRGLSTLSLHSWAIAIDINAAWNGLGKEPTMSKLLVACFTDAGFEWGGLWTRKDGMHFQLNTI
jgi:hypothetical protein